jgi:serine/threonine protein kinase
MADPSKRSRGKSATADLPDTIGPYRILRRIGEGGMGVVYLGTDDAAGRDAAVKVMLAKAAANPISRERFLREGRAMARIQSPHVVAVYHVGEDNGVPYIAMEYLAGLSVEDRLKAPEPVAVPEAQRIVREAALGLAAAHVPGLVHRDIKPSNLWLEVPSGRVKVLDFGLARDPHAETNLTRAGTVLGTPAYMAPEQARGLPVDARTDLFSLGAVGYHLLTGQSPFLGKNAVETLTRVVTEEPPPLRAARPDVTEPLASVIDRLLKKDPAERFATARDVAEALAPPPAAAPPPPAAPPPSVTVPPAAPRAVPLPNAPVEPEEFGSSSSYRLRRRRFPWTPLLAVAFAVAAAGVFFAALSYQPDEPPAPPADPPGPPPTARASTPAPDDGRALADWAVRRGYAVRVEGNPNPLRDTTTLPPGPVSVLAVLVEKGTVLLTPEDRKFFRSPYSWTDADLEQTRSDPAAAKVRLVVVNSPAVTDAGVAALAARTGVVYLDLRATRVTDRGLDVAAKMPDLARLSVADTSVGDAGLVWLSQLPKLMWVDARGSKVSRDGVKIFQRGKPGRVVLMDSKG